jgi:alpha-amylase
LQNEAFSKLYELVEKVEKSNDLEIQKDFGFLQTSDNFYYMCTKWLASADVHKYFTHYPSPYDAFINYMNVLSDFTMQLQKVDVPETKVDVKALQQELLDKDRQLKIARLQLDKWRTNIAKAMQDDEKMEKPLRKGRTKKEPVFNEGSLDVAPVKRSGKKKVEE